MLIEFLVYERVVEVNPSEVIAVTGQLIIALYKAHSVYNTLPFLIKMHPTAADSTPIYIESKIRKSLFVLRNRNKKESLFYLKCLFLKGLIEIRNVVLIREVHAFK